MAARRALILLAFFAVSAVSAGTGRSICDSCACTPDNVAPVTVNCTCSKTKLLIVREQDAPLLSSVQDLTLASCGFVSLPSTGLSSSLALTRVTVRDMKLFHYTTGLFPALQSLSVEDVGELVLDGFGPANRTLRDLTLRRTTIIRLVRGTVTSGAPLHRVLFDRVNVDEIESGALDMTFVDGTDGAADGFTIVNSTIKSVQSDGVTVRSGALNVLNSTLDELAAGAAVAHGPVRLSGNRLDAVRGDSVTAVRPDGGDVLVDGNAFRELPADVQLFKSERPAVEFRDNAVGAVDLARFLFGVGPAVRVTGNRFTCDCDPRRVSVLKLDQVFPGLLPDADTRFARLLADNYCDRPADTTLAGYKDLLVKEITCKGTNVTVVTPPPKQPATRPAGSSSSSGRPITAAGAVVCATVLTAVVRRIS